jgi:heptosyltransferase II
MEAAQIVTKRMKNLKETIKEGLRLPLEALFRVYLASLPPAQSPPQNVERILVFAYHGLGNFIMYTPALKLLRQRYPQARIDLQVGNNTGCEDVLAGADTFDHIYNLPYKAGLRAWFRRLREMRRTRYDLTINEFHSHSWALALTIAASGATYRVGHVTSPGWSKRFSRYSFVFNLPVVMGEEQHETERYLDLVAAAGAARSGMAEVKPFMHLTAADREFARAFIASHNQTDSAARQPAKRLLGIQPGTSPTMRWKQWPLERYRQLLERLLVEQPEAQMILFGAPNEAEMIRELAAGLGANISIAAGKTTVKQVAALIEKCDLLVCNDSGLMHVAVAVDTPVVAIYGPTDFHRTAPLGSRHTVIRHPLPCSPCFKLEGDEMVHLCQHHDCLMTINANEVFYQIEKRLLSQPGESAIADGESGQSIAFDKTGAKFGLHN